MILALALTTGLAAAATSCAGSPSAPSDFAPFSTTDLVVGTGATAASGSLLGVTYTGWLYDATQPDQKGAVFNSTDGTTTPFSFTLGVGSVVAGWDQGLPGMQVGGVRRLVVPPSLAYGNERQGPIPPNATLIFEISLVSVQ
jgi:FKBP-type peptidyl-prolyl cis-trans isomerase FkpA